MKKYGFIRDELEKREKECRRRFLRTVAPVSGSEVQVDGRRLLNFCSNDYLGLSKHPLLKERALEFARLYGSGSTASRLICGNYTAFDDVEKKLASLKSTEAALILNSGYQANASLLPALTDQDSLIFSDRLNHRSIIQGAMLSRCKIVVYDHNNINKLRQLIKQYRDTYYSRILIVTESVFSVDGDLGDIDSLIELSEEFEALLIVDEAHATGIMGPRGMGLTAGKKVDLTIGTFGKACGSFGAYVTCSEEMRDYLINCCPGFIYTTALPPFVVGSIDAALELIPQMEKERRDLLFNADYLRKSLHELGFDTGESSSHIVPVIIGDEEEALSASAWLEENSVFATALRPPTVEEGRSRIRLAVTALHPRQDVDKVIDIFRRWKKRDA
ncbi:MAG: 8-amino-7-oxononanoate synthase [Desulfatiglans sp.]|jgi:8-amino-7-oxononanoate synthase|nr:8-amino-7-oxononanoate synthase [Desulfatiglans sp.]